MLSTKPDRSPATSAVMNKTWRPSDGRVYSPLHPRPQPASVVPKVNVTTGPPRQASHRLQRRHVLHRWPSRASHRRPSRNQGPGRGGDADAAGVAGWPVRPDRALPRAGHAGTGPGGNRGGQLAVAAGRRVFAQEVRPRFASTSPVSLPGQALPCITGPSAPRVTQPGKSPRLGGFNLAEPGGPLAPSCPCRLVVI